MTKLEFNLEGMAVNEFKAILVMGGIIPNYPVHISLVEPLMNKNFVTRTESTDHWEYHLTDKGRRLAKILADKTWVDSVYTNYRGVTEGRTLLPMNLYFGESEFHPGKSYILQGICKDKGYREFEMSGFSDWKASSHVW